MNNEGHAPKTQAAAKACTDATAELLAAVREYVRTGHSVPTYRAIEAALKAYDEVHP